MSTEQVDNTQEEYDELYDKGFEDKDTSIDGAEDKEEEVEQEEQPEEGVDDAEEETSDEEVTEEPEDETTEEDSRKYTITYKGQEMNLTEDEIKTMAQKGFDYTSKTQSLAKQRDIVELAVEHGLTKEDLKILADAKSGNKEAMAMIASKGGIDPYDIEEVGEYKPEVSNRNYELEDIVQDIKSDMNNGSTIDTWITQLPDGAVDSFRTNPSVLKGLHIDAQKGIAQKVMPEVIKYMAMNPGADFVQAYAGIGQQIVGQAQQTQEPEARRVVDSATKKKASISKKSSNAKHISDQKDIWNDDELYAKMQKMREQ